MAFDEEGQADNLERRKEICGRAYRILTEEVGFPAEDIIFDPNCFAVATGIEEHATYGDRLHRGHPLDQGEPARGARSPAASRTCRSRSAATTRCARRSTRCSCSTPSRPAWTWASSTPARWCVYDADRPRAARADRGRRPQPSRRTRPSGCSRSPSEFNGAGRRPRTADGAEWRSLPVARADHPRAGQGHRRPRRGRHRGAAGRDRRARRSPDRGDRGPADGRHERRR